MKGVNATAFSHIYQSIRIQSQVKQENEMSSADSKKLCKFFSRLMGVTSDCIDSEFVEFPGIGTGTVRH